MEEDASLINRLKDDDRRRCRPWEFNVGRFRHARRTALAMIG
jgi:hypothetical protein